MVVAPVNVIVREGDSLGGGLKIGGNGLESSNVKGTGGVFSGFPSCYINQTGCVAFGAFLFKRPNGFPAGAGPGGLWRPGQTATHRAERQVGDGLTGTTCNERVTVRLAADRQTLENKGKTDKVKMKAVSTADKQFRDAFQITIKFTPVP